MDPRASFTLNTAQAIWMAEFQTTGEALVAGMEVGTPIQSSKAMPRLARSGCVLMFLCVGLGAGEATDLDVKSFLRQHAERAAVGLDRSFDCIRVSQYEQSSRRESLA